MIKTFDDFIYEGLSPRDKDILTKFLDNLTGYTFSDPKQLDTFASFIFKTQMTNDGPEETDGDETIYRYAKGDVVIDFHCSQEGDKYVLSKAEII